MYAIFRPQGTWPDGAISYKIYSRSYSTYRGNWIWASVNMMGQPCAAHSSPKPAIWKTREAAERTAQKLRPSINQPFIEVREIGPRDNDIRAACRYFAPEMFDHIRGESGDVDDIVSKVLAVAMGKVQP